ncbi:MAG: four helix bundle protein [Paludibacteraceae bacterium]|nr:four helix bundle protein [Paludibacteraceae bacterium]
MEFFGYRKLVAYIKASEVRRRVYRLIRKFPKEEQFALCSQMRRAAVSITSNIAEGMTRYSAKDKIHFLEISFGSLMELMSQLEVAIDEEYISEEEFHNIETLIAETGRLLSGLQKSFQTDKQTDKEGEEPKLKTLN